MGIPRGLCAKTDPLEDLLKNVGFRRMTIPKLAVLATGLAAAVLVATINPAPVAQAFPNKQQECLNCHGVGAPAGVEASADLEGWDRYRVC